MIAKIQTEKKIAMGAADNGGHESRDDHEFKL
jgi:hypothetical protein